ncbi:hypothetical protein E1286_01780 [Nonomuraea terrae]|uniref:YtkA-like domain-containing protein n=1 Tax=Nonomuraea terrae TaxID=2530383 RepID=A0A4R4ZG71_9ACTN|nr:hypothetical protein [Nonomuraea terrae]TDD56389.1 hypothetical protein E1286_01780 [Nonomuraea terrae]
MSKLRPEHDRQPGAPAPARRPAPAGRRRPRASAGLTPFRHGLLLGGCVGMTFALAIGVVGFLVTRPTAPVAGPAAGAQPAALGAAAARSAAAIDVTATHLGDLQVRIEAQVSAPRTYDPITRAQVVAWTDMVAMPMAHREGPIVMTEVPGRPGTYQALTKVAMVGEYNITVETRQPMASKADRRLEVQEVSKGAEARTR